MYNTVLYSLGVMILKAWCCSQSGRTCLHVACQGSRLETVEFLVELGGKELMLKLSEPSVRHLIVKICIWLWNLYLCHDCLNFQNQAWGFCCCETLYTINVSPTINRNYNQFLLLWNLISDCETLYLIVYLIVKRYVWL